MADQAAFENLMRQIISNDNAARKAAEEQFREGLQKAPDAVAMSLLRTIRTASEYPLRELCTVLLRKNITFKDSESSAFIEDDDDDDDDEDETNNTTEGEETQPPVFWKRLSDQVKGNIKNELLNALKLETVSTVRHNLEDCVASLALYLSATTGSWDISKEWPDLVNTAFQLAQSQNVEHRITALNIFSKLCLYIGESIKVHSKTLQQVFAASLQDKQSIKVRISALDATVSFIQLLETAEERKMYQNFTPLMFETLSAALNQGKEDECVEALQTLVELAEAEPRFLRPHLPVVIRAMLSISNEQKLSSPVRQLGLEFMVTLCEKAAGMCRKIPDFVKNLVPVVLNFMLDLKEDPEWAQHEDDEDDDDLDVTNSDVGNECLDRLALYLGGKTLIPVLFQLIPNLLKNQDWKHRATGLMAVALVAEGCSKYLTPHLEEIVKFILPHLSDSHPRVRYGACNTLGQLSTDFGPYFQTKFNGTVLPALAKVMEDTGNPRIQSHAAAAVINFCEHATDAQLIPYLDDVLQHLSQLLTHGRRDVQEQAVTAIAAIADVVKGAFLKYYDHFVPLLGTVLQRASSKEYRMLRGKALECVTLIGHSVGKEKFLKDAKPVLELLKSIQLSKLEADDPQIPFVRAAWARVCNTIGEDFVPYMDLVMPLLLEDASLDPSLTVTDVADTKQDGYHYVPIGNKKIGINTTLMEEKAAACNMIFQYASALKGAFAPYVEKVATILVPLMTFYFNDGVRAAATAAMPALLLSVRDRIEKDPVYKGDKTPLLKLFSLIFPELSDGANSEMEMDVLLLMLETLCEIVEICGAPLKNNNNYNNHTINTNGSMGCLTKEQMEIACETVAHQITEREKRLQERRKMAEDEDYDEHENEKALEESEKDDEVLSEVAELIGRILKFHPNNADFVKLFGEKLFQPTLQLLQRNRSSSERQSALCILDDVIEFGGPSAFPLYQHFLPLMMDYIGDMGSPAVRQAAVYGAGVFAQVSGDRFGNVVQELLNRLVTVITHQDSRKKENKTATENAISAVGKIAKFQAKSVDQAKVLTAWFSFLPVDEDKEEARVTYAQLCYFIENCPNLIFGDGNKNLPKILSIFALVLGTKFVTEEVTQNIWRILNKMQTSFSPDILQQALASLPAEHRAKLLAGAKQ